MGDWDSWGDDNKASSNDNGRSDTNNSKNRSSNQGSWGDTPTNSNRSSFYKYNDQDKRKSNEKQQESNNQGWDDGWGGSSTKSDDRQSRKKSDWTDSASTSNDRGWDSGPSKSNDNGGQKSDGWNDGPAKSNNQGWGDSPNKRSGRGNDFGNRNTNDQGNRKSGGWNDSNAETKNQSWNDGGNNPRPSGDGDDKEERPAPYRPEELNLEEEAKLQMDTVGENFSKYKEQVVTCIPLSVMKPIEKFEDVIESKLLLENVKSLRYDELTPIQKWAMPSITQGYDLIGCAQTGSGKTAAFLLPILQTIMKNDLTTPDQDENCQNPFCIIISPTRELAKQIYTQSKMLSKDSLVKSCYIYGQIATAHLKSQLSKGCHILVATLGRLKDFMQRGWIGFQNIKYIVLDEGDRLVDEGFSSELNAIFEHPTMPPKTDRQTLFFSATFPKKVQLSAREYMKDNFIFITVGRVGAANEDIKQEFLQVSRAEKKRELRSILKEVPETDKTIIFTQTKAAADMLAGFFNSLKLSATSIHGDRHQSQREEAINLFRRGDKRFLISSPVGNRGLDLPKVALVINYDLPDSIDEYVHRIGRTGRAGHTGRAISFFDSDRDREILPDLIKILEEAKQEIPSFLKEMDCPSASSDDAFAPNNSNQQSGSGGFDDDWGCTSNAPPKSNPPRADATQSSSAAQEDDWGASANKSDDTTSMKRLATDEACGQQKKLDTGSKASTNFDEEW